MAKINVGKWAGIVFGTHESEHHNSNIRMAGQEMKRVQNLKYLGVIKNENISFVPDVDSASGTFLRQINAVYGKFYYMSTEVLCLLATGGERRRELPVTVLWKTEQHHNSLHIYFSYVVHRTKSYSFLM